MKQEPPAILDLAAFDFNFFFQDEPIPPIFFELVALIAVMAAGADHRAFLETGIDPLLEFQGGDGGHG